LENLNSEKNQKKIFTWKFFFKNFSTSQPSSPIGDGTCLLSKDPEVLKECISDEFKRPEETMAQGLKRHAVNLVVDF